MLRKFFIISALLLMPLFSLALAVPVLAQDSLNVWGSGTDSDVDRDDLREATRLADTDPRTIAARVVNVILGFLGIIAVILILFGGFKWMTAAGNEDAIADARKIMMAGVVGLVIVLAAFGIAQFVVDSLVTATTTP